MDGPYDRYCTRWYYSTAWSTVEHFYKYWKKEHGATGEEYSKNKDLRKALNLGDIVQLKTKSRGWMHSIIISCKKGGEWRYAAHSNNHKYKKVSDIKDSKYCKYRIIRPK